MIDVDKFPKTYEKAKAAYGKVWPYVVKNFENTHNKCVNDIGWMEDAEEKLCSTRCIDMMYRMLCRLFTEAERAWLLATFSNRERNRLKSSHAYMRLINSDETDLDFILNEMKNHTWEKAEKKRLQDEEEQALQRSGIDYERFQKKVMWFVILLDKLRSLDDDFFELDPEWVEAYESGIVAIHL